MQPNVVLNLYSDVPSMKSHVFRKDLRLSLYVDADFAGCRLTAKSTSGGFLVLKGPNTFFPLSWVSKRQTSVSRSTTESEVVSLAFSLFGEAIPTLCLWERLLGKPVLLECLEDNQATIVIAKAGWSSKLRHVQRTHKVNIASLAERFKEDTSITLEYVDTSEQAADIFTKALDPQKWDPALRMLGVSHPEVSKCAQKLKSCIRPTEGGA